jgi:hypothetical protein
MTRINAIRTNAARTTKEAHSMSWGRNTGALIFAAVLIVCSVTVGCSSSNSNDNAQPKPVTANNQIPVPPLQSQSTSMPAPVQPATKPAPTKVVHKKPATVNYADKTYGVTFEYPRRYAIETGDAATELLASNPMPMNFVEPGGVALAAVELPETGFANTDFSSAFFDVSVHKSLTADQCTEFAVPQPKTMTPSVTPASTTDSASTTAAAPSSTTQSAAAQPTSTQPVSTQPQAGSEQSTAVKPSTEPASNSKLMLGDLELRATEAVSGEGSRQSDSKYFHVFQNGSCYEFALNVTTDASEEGLVKHVDRDKVFTRLEQILATVKIDTVKVDPVKADTAKTDPLPAPEAIAGAPANVAAQTPAQ